MIRKVIFAIIVGIMLITGLSASNSVSYKVFLPIVIRGNETQMLQCYHYLHDTYGISAGYVQAWALVEYHEQYDAVRLIPQGYDKNGNPIIWKWETHTADPILGIQPELNYLWQNPDPDTNWHGYGVPITVGSAWEAVTHIGGSKGYTIYAYIFPKSYSNYPIRCDLFEH
jgi:hypothetical protein